MTPVPTGPITWAELSVILTLLSLLSAGVGWLWRQLTAVRKELTDFQIKAAEKYVTDTALERVENKLTDAINRMSDGIGARFDKLMVELIQAVRQGP